MTRMKSHFVGTLLGMWIVLGERGYSQHSFPNKLASNEVCISGDISFNGDTSDLTVGLRSFGASTISPQRASVTGAGMFDLGCVREGLYHVIIVNGVGNVVHEEAVTAGPGHNRLTIHLAEKRTTSPNPQTVSIHELSKKVNRKAASEVRKAREMLERSQTKAAMAHVMKALEKDPYFVEAHMEAGIIHVVMNDHEQAVAAFRKAAELDPGCVQAHNNLAIELLKLKQYSDAEHAARRALKLDHTRRSMEYALGASLSYQGRNPEEALKYLRRAAVEYPRARLAAAKVLFETGHKSDAVSELKLYLSSNIEAAQRAQIEAWLARVQ